MYVYTITFCEGIMVEKARQGLLLFMEVFYDSTKAMVCLSGGGKDSEILFFEDGVVAPRHALVETIINIDHIKLKQILNIIFNILKIWSILRNISNINITYIFSWNCFIYHYHFITISIFN